MRVKRAAHCIILAAMTLAMAFSAPVVAEPEDDGAKIGLDKKELYFAEPYNFLDPPLGDMMGMNLELDYAAIKYPNGFVNTIDGNEPMIVYRKRLPVEKPESLAKVRELSGFDRADRVTVIAGDGKAYLAKIAGFSIVGTSNSTIAVMADLEFADNGPDPSLIRFPCVALRGVKEYESPGPIAMRVALIAENPLTEKLFRRCAGESDGRVIERFQVAAATVSTDGDEAYFVSFWERPRGDYEIEDIKLSGCMLKPSGDSYDKSNFPVKAIKAHDLDGNGRPEILGITGNGALACLVYLELGKEKHALIRKGSCVGY